MRKAPQEKNILEVSQKEDTLTNAMMNLDSENLTLQSKSLININNSLTNDRF